VQDAEIAPVGLLRGLRLAGLGEVGGKLERGGQLRRQCRPLGDDQRVHCICPPEKPLSSVDDIEYLLLYRVRVIVNTDTRK
jgi:hypothetical protein